MSLVGPRPIVSQEIERYADGFYYYQLVTPGIYRFMVKLVDVTMLIIAIAYA